MIEITFEDARRFILDVQGLRANKLCDSAIDVAKRIHNIQIDTISVVYFEQYCRVSTWNGPTKSGFGL